MTTETLYQELEYVNHSRDNRLKYANMVLNDANLIPKILEILWKVDDKISPRAAWLLEFVAREDLTAILPYLDDFTSNMHRVHLDPAVRPIAKICEYLVEAYYHKNPHPVKSALKQQHKERITEVCFDYLITDQKIAPQAYSMNTLYLLGRDYDWIHAELIQILERGYPQGSAGYKARARRLLSLLKK